MTIVALGPAGLTRVTAALATGTPVLLPMPSPITYALCAGDPAALNRAKGRPPDQAVGLAVTDVQQVAPHLGLSGQVLDLVQWLMASELVSVLAPVLPGAPAWMRPCVVEGHASLIGGWLAPVAALLARSGPVYVSSSNLTGGRPGATAAEADAAFDGHLLALDGDSVRARSADNGSSTVVRVSARGALDLIRPGVRLTARPGAQGRDDVSELLWRFEHRFEAQTP